jgi:mxaJ protein
MCSPSRSDVAKEGRVPFFACLRRKTRTVRILAVIALAAACRWVGPAAAAPAPELRVCADPNNLPFSNDEEKGFENALAALVARDMGARVRYTWWAQRRGFVRNTLNARACDVIMGVPARFELTATTRPYYRSTYVFVQRADDRRRIASFDDPVLQHLRIGVQMIGDDGANAPPAHALSNRHIVRNVVGYSVYGDYSKPNPPARIVEAVARGEIDVAVAWGPLAGYFADKETVPLRLTPVSPQMDSPALPFVFDIAMGVRRDDAALRMRLDAIIQHRRSEIDRLLAAYHVPRVDGPNTGSRSRGPAHEGGGAR